MKLRYLPMLLGIGLLSGCGGGHDYADVSGTVTLNGEPLPDAWVEFQPVGEDKDAKLGFGARGKTDAQGRYTLRTAELDDDHDGVVVGKHMVRISCFDGGEGGDALAEQADADNPRDRKKSNVPVVPAKYNENTELTFTVEPGGTDKADFKLEMPKRKSR